MPAQWSQAAADLEDLHSLAVASADETPAMKVGFLPAPVLAASVLALRLRAGEAAIIPTDTLPGLAVLPDQAQTLWRLKCRPADKPLILMGASVNDLLHEVEGSCHREVEALAERYWPGALTRCCLPVMAELADISTQAAQRWDAGFRLVSRHASCFGSAGRWPLPVPIAPGNPPA